MAIPKLEPSTSQAPAEGYRRVIRCRSDCIVSTAGARFPRRRSTILTLYRLQGIPIDGLGLDPARGRHRDRCPLLSVHAVMPPSSNGARSSTAILRRDGWADPAREYREVGMSLRQIAAKLTEDGINTASGGQWTATAVKNLLDLLT
jgi:hypothetical protein